MISGTRAKLKLRSAWILPEIGRFVLQPLGCEVTRCQSQVVSFCRHITSLYYAPINATPKGSIAQLLDAAVAATAAVAVKSAISIQAAIKPSGRCPFCSIRNHGFLCTIAS